MSMQQCRCQHLKVTADPQRERELEWIEDVDVHTHTASRLDKLCAQKCYSDPGCILVIFYGLRPVRPF